VTYSDLYRRRSKVQSLKSLFPAPRLRSFDLELLTKLLILITLSTLVQTEWGITIIEYIEGNDAIVRGAIDAGCKFFAGYPITPASSILHEMVRELPKVGGTVIQTEDEITAIGCCLGASMTGMKVMTASSGPGLSLYSENIGMAIMTETPMVIVDVQRSTNSPTAGADTDIQFVRWGTSGGIPIVALVPTTVEECYLFTILAFNISESLRIPVFIMSNKELALLRERVDLDAVKKPKIMNRKKVRKNVKTFIPYNFEKLRDIPLIADFGGDQLVRHTNTMHWKDGFITKDPARIQEMWYHYSAKICRRKDELEFVEFDLQKNARSVIISYGVTARSAREAVNLVRGRGRKVSLLVLKSIWPVPEKAINRAIKGCTKVIVPELNLGQYVREIERVCYSENKNIRVVPIAKINTRLITPAEIVKKGGI